MRAVLSRCYAVVVYAFFAVTFLYAIAFVGNLPVPRSIDSGPPGPVVTAMMINLALLGLFAFQHSIMARRSFKRWWTTVVPPALERSTFVLAATLALALMLWQWRPMPAVVWSVTTPALVDLLEAIFWIGWAVFLVSTFLINHSELFGLRQAFTAMTGRDLPQPEFKTPLIYRYVRHPIYLGILLGFWAAPVMTAGHLLFAVGATGYILVGIWFEERDLIHQFGEQYRSYRRRVGMLVPSRRAS